MARRAGNSVPCAPKTTGGQFAALFEDVRENVKYYVEGDGVRSKEFKLSVGQPVALGSLDVIYKFPSWSGLPRAHREKTPPTSAP